jgi:CheY-like chemotaxis protein
VSSRERAGQPTGAERRSPEPGRKRIAMIIEPDEATQKQLTGLLSSRGFRVVPVANADNGLELAHRMRFDAAFCAVRAPGLNWVELSERLHTRVGGFILLSEGYDAELSADFEGDGRYVLAKPLQEAELDRIVDSIAAASNAKVVNIRDIVA